MSKLILLERLQEFTETATGDLLLPVEMQEDDLSPPAPRAPAVYLMDLPQLADYERKAPYILHQVLTGKDAFTPDSRAGTQNPESTAVVRSVFCVYHPDRQQGGLALLSLMERLRTALLRLPVLGDQFRLDLREGLNSLVYQDDLGAKPFYLGELLSVWCCPFVQRLDTLSLTGSLPTQDPWNCQSQQTITRTGGIHYGKAETWPRIDST